MMILYLLTCPNHSILKKDGTPTSSYAFIAKKIKRNFLNNAENPMKSTLTTIPT